MIVVMDGSNRPDFVPIADPRPDDRPWPTLRWPMPSDLALTGKHVRLDPVSPSTEAEPLFAALDHPEVWQHLPVTPASVSDYQELLESRCRLGDSRTFTVRLINGLGAFPAGSIVGSSSFLSASVRDSSVEIGATAYSPAAWGTVVNPECKLLMLSHAFEVLDAGRVQIKTDVRNARAQEAIARLGARFEGVLRRHFRRADGTVRDTVMFSIIAEEWPRVRAGLITRLGTK